MASDLHPPWSAQAKQLRLGDVCVDLRYRRVERDGERIELPQRMFDLLLLFVSEPGVLHERTDLFRRIWPGVIVEDGNLSQSVWMLRKALGESRRHWLRTVAKRGYVFEPPQAPEAVVEAEETRPAEAGSSGEDGSVATADPVAVSMPMAGARRRVRLGRWLAAAGVVVSVGLTILLQGRSGQVVRSPTAVSLIVLADQADRSGAVPAALLEAWLGWQLSMLPDVLLLSPAHLAADSDKQDTTRLVTLSAGPLSGETGRIYVQAALQGDDTLRVEGSEDQMAFLVDDLARQVRNTLLPGRVGQVWPSLRVESGIAERYLALRRARDAKQWSRAAEIGEDLLRQAPQFGLAWFDLAQVHSMLGRVQPAQAHLERAQALLTPLPKEVGWLIEAQLLALGSDHDAAVAAYSDLAREHPHQPRFVLELARAQIRAGQYGQARQNLSPDVWLRQPASVRIGQLLIRGDAELALGDVAAARASARQADDIAEQAGWAYERGWATLLLAQADAMDQREAADMDLFDRAAGHFESAGDDMHALRTRLLGASISANGAAVTDDLLDALLDQARTAGHPRLAMHALRAVAYRHYRDGRLDAYRARLQQAEDLAHATGDQHALALFEVDRVNEDIMSGDLRRAGRRLDRMREAGGMQGEAGQWMSHFDAYLAYREGRLGDAWRLLGEYAKGETTAPANDLRHCLAGAVANAQGDMAQARGHYRRCGESVVPVVVLVAEVGLAEVELRGSDAEAVQERISGALARLDQLDSVPDRWLVELDAAGVLLRAGESERAAGIYERLLPSLSGSGYRLLEMDALIGLAETAVVQGDWIGVQRRIEQAEQLFVARDWLLESRLSLVRVVHAQAVGEHNAAAGHLHRLDRQAHRHGDTLVQSLTHELFQALAIEAACDVGGQGRELPKERLASEATWLLSSLPMRLVDINTGG